MDYNKKIYTNRIITNNDTKFLNELTQLNKSFDNKLNKSDNTVLNLKNKFYKNYNKLWGNKFKKIYDDFKKDSIDITNENSSKLKFNYKKINNSSLSKKSKIKIKLKLNKNLDNFKNLKITKKLNQNQKNKIIDNIYNKSNKKDLIIKNDLNHIENLKKNINEKVNKSSSNSKLKKNNSPPKFKENNTINNSTINTANLNIKNIELTNKRVEIGWDKEHKHGINNIYENTTFKANKLFFNNFLF